MSYQITNTFKLNEDKIKELKKSNDNIFNFIKSYDFFRKNFKELLKEIKIKYSLEITLSDSNIIKKHDFNKYEEQSLNTFLCIIIDIFLDSLHDNKLIKYDPIKSLPINDKIFESFEFVESLREYC